VLAKIIAVHEIGEIILFTSHFPLVLLLALFMRIGVGGQGGQGLALSMVPGSWLNATLARVGSSSGCECDPSQLRPKRWRHGMPVVKL
jgi:hypothetical protein